MTTEADQLALFPELRAGEHHEGDGPPTILILESEEVNRLLLRGTLKSEGYRILETGDAREAFRLLEREKADLIILDLMMPEISGLEFCREIRARPQTRLIPVVILTSVHGVETEIASLESGADEFLVKPLHPAIVRTHIRAMLRHKAAIDSLEDAEAILFSLAQAIEHRDKSTSGHCARLAIMSISMGMALGLPRPQLLALHRGGFLHDIGKIAVPDSILFKAGPLTEEEWRVMRRHTVQGEEICRPTKSLAPVLPIIRNHHERWDGSGYPDGLRGEAIPLLARILQVTDIFDALTSPRPYKTALSPAAALEALEGEARRGWRDPNLVVLLRRLIEKQPSLAAPAAMQESLENMRRALLE